ncbi:hypothetical protein PILCRDRAFT_15186 [Piloderma croceum F 1598]|uniref:Uncharacterized protein n=1 Tax=Piloderma croceum (strain F 1598) TaxID=765440 RepID=A0A0C3AI90_PILCF|nr:hypothetical protein PILCRDRAFT_15186 [Piloderma croceum F 1598]
MDIKFIGSGASAKAILYYITDYIMKAQLKTHVAYATLELAVSKLGEYDPDADEMANRSKKLLQKCAFAMISHQELSAQLVCSYLMDYEDHFTSHKFRNLYWTTFEKYVEIEDPSLECRVTSNISPTNSMVEDPELLSEVDALKTLHDEDDGVAEPEAEVSVNESIETIQSVNEELHGLEDNPLSDDEDEVAITLDHRGNLVARANQVADYRLRGNHLEDICVWDFVARVEKCQRETHADEDDENGDATRDDTDGESSTDAEEQPQSTASVLSLRTWSRPRVQFLPGHLESASHFLRVIAPCRRRVPVLIGPEIPRRDRDENCQRYSRLMLILFKPWRHIRDLRDAGQSWSDALEKYLHVCPHDAKTVMDNMQILHECKDSRDDHFAERRVRGRNRSNRIP